MAKKVKLFKTKTYKTNEEVSKFLQELGQKIAEDQLILRQTPEDMVLKMPQNMAVQVKVNKKKKRAKGTRHKLTIQLSWFESDQQGDPLALG